jgi:formylglycine-generating enzyme required for sulfatase activity
MDTDGTGSTEDSSSTSDGTGAPECGGHPAVDGFVCVEAGAYAFGCHSRCDELPPALAGDASFPYYAAAEQRQLSAFQIMATEVTASQYAACVDAGACASPVCTDPYGTWPMAAADASRPITCVTPADAQAYCAWFGESGGLSSSVPTECQWEKAARGSADARLYASGDVAPGCPDAALGGLGSPPPCVGLAGPSDVATHANDVSSWGAYDMSGNVSELASSRIGSGEVVWLRRGGAWDDDPFVATAASRVDLRRPFAAVLDSFPSSVVGFRCVVGQADAEAIVECPPPG